MNKVYVLDACALISLLLHEDGADKVADVYREANFDNAKLLMNVVNLLEVYYDFYRAYGKTTADDMFCGLGDDTTGELPSPMTAQNYVRSGRIIEFSQRKQKKANFILSTQRM